MTRPDTPAAAWQALHEGNLRFVRGVRAHPHQDADRRAELAAGQRPFALIFGCSDSRVAAEIIFDRGLGDLFVVRTAGHVVDSAVLGSVEFGVEQLQIPLVVVLGHDSCGAVAAAIDAQTTGRMPQGFVRDVVERVAPSVLAARSAGRSTIDDVVDEHTRQTARLLVERSDAIARRVEAGTCAIVSVRYTLDEGRTRRLDAVGAIDPGADR